METTVVKKKQVSDKMISGSILISNRGDLEKLVSKVASDFELTGPQAANALAEALKKASGTFK